MGLNNINSNGMQKPIDRSKSKQNINGKDKEPEKGLKKNDGDASAGGATGTNADKEATEASKQVEGTAEGTNEEPVQEVKKPRYFPPKKLPNPFENAAQEQEKFL